MCPLRAHSSLSLVCFAKRAFFDVTARGVAVDVGCWLCFSLGVAGSCTCSFPRRVVVARFALVMKLYCTAPRFLPAEAQTQQNGMK